jgi:hypothetical protein
MSRDASNARSANGKGTSQVGPENRRPMVASFLALTLIAPASPGDF